MSGKGSKQRPTNKIAYDTNYDAIFGRKYTAPEADYELCPFCGIRAETVCEGLPADTCEQAINVVHGAWLNDLN